MLALLTIVLGVICIAESFASTGSENPIGMSETITTAVTCGKRANPCCAREGVLIRYIAMCDDVGYIDPTGKRCIEDTYGICSWQNGTATSTMDLHCHSQGPDDPEPHCHFHEAPHVLGSEPGDVK